MGALRLALRHAPRTPVIILTNPIDEDTGVRCMKAGATDYVTKDHIERLGPAVSRSLGDQSNQAALLERLGWVARA